MSSLTTCAKKVGTALDPKDKAAVMARAREFRATGLGATEAAIKAARDLIAELRAQLPAETKPQAPKQMANAGTKHPATVMGSRLLAVVSKRLGGLDPAWLAEFSTRSETKRMGKDGRPIVQWRNPMVTGIGKLFRHGGTQDLQRIAEVLEEEGYLAPGSVEADYKEAGEAAKTMIQRALQKGEVQTLDEQQAEIEAGQEADRQAYYAELDAEAAREAEAERQAIIEANDLDRIDLLPDDDIPWDLDMPSTASIEQTAAFLGITVEELQNEGLQGTVRQDEPTQAGAGQEDRIAAAQGPQPPPEAGGAAQGQGSEQGLTLEAQTPADLKAKADREQAAAAADKAEQKRLADKANGDAQRDEFVLTGSDRPADVAAAAGQGDIFDQPDGKTLSEPDAPTYGQDTLQGVRDTWAAAGIEGSMHERNGTITLSQIVVPKGRRGMGAGTDAMLALTAYADRTGQLVVLSPSTDFGATSKSRLIAFYKGLGFFENKGRNKDFTTMESMIREPSKASRANEPGREYSDAYATDLFGNPVPAPAGSGRKARPAGAAVRGDAQPEPGVPGDTAPPAGDYHVRTTVGVTANRLLGAKTIKTAADAAAATRYLYRSAVERFDGIVTDKAGKPLAVIGGFKGALSQTSIYPATLMGEAVRVPGAAFVWFSHNHPSGGASLSTADERLNLALSDVFRGSGIEPKGLLAIGRTQFAHVDDYGNGGSIIDLPKSTATTTVPAIEREIASDEGGREEIVSPQRAKGASGEHYRAAGRVPGIMLMDSQHRIAGWVSLGKETLGKLRNTGGLTAIYRAVSESNAGAAILVHGGELNANVPGSGITIGQNIGAALAKIDVRPLDIINAVTGESAAEQGMKTSAGPVLSHSDPQARGIPFTDLERMVSTIAANWSVRAKPQVVATASDLPAPIVNALRSMNAMGTTRGLRMPDGRVFLVADKLNSMQEAQAVLFHEVLGHEGLRAFLGDRYVTQMALLRIANPKLAAEANTWYAAYGQDQINARIEAGMTRESAGAEVRALAVEEALADRAGEGVTPKAWKAVMAALQKALRGMNLAWIADRLEAMTEAETYATLIGARRAIERGAELPQWLRAGIASEAPLMQRVWHGTPARNIDRFSTDFIGAGEGNQAYGWGLYFASRKEVADYYREALTPRGPATLEKALRVPMDQADALWAAARVKTGDLKSNVSAETLLMARSASLRKLSDQERSALLDRAVAVMQEARGAVYAVEIPEDDEMLLWDKPLADQPTNVRDALAPFIERYQARQREILSAFPEADAQREINASLKSMDGQGVYEQVGYMEGGGDRSASEYLASLGIKGIKYLDGLSRDGGKGSHNYVIFSGDDARIQQALLKRTPPPVETTTTPEGQPAFRGQGLVLDFPLPTERLEIIPEPGQQVLNYPIMPADSFESLGYVELLVENGKPTSLLDIYVNPDVRGGVGRRVIETLLAANPADDLNISNIVESARGFWERMGVPQQNRAPGEAYDGTLNWQTYAQAQAENQAAAGSAGKGSRAARGGTDAGAEGRVQGSVGQAPLLSRTDQTKTPEFKAWFGDSKVVDAQGRPLVVYHGTASTDISAFMPRDEGNGANTTRSMNLVEWFRKIKSENGRLGYMNFRSGSFFSPDPAYAGNYTGEAGGVMYPVYIRAENPVYMDQRTGVVTGFDASKTPDALILRDGDKINEVAVIDPTQIKSAIGNRGTFDPANPNILYSRATIARRDFMMGIAATMAAAPASADVTIGKARPINEADLRAKVTPAAEKILRGNGATNIEGAKALKEAIAEIAANGPPSLRALAAEVGRLIPNDRLMLTVNDKRLVNAHGVVELHPLPHMTLFTAEGRTGLSNSTVLHEALHAAVMARYHTLGTAVIRSNDAKLKMDAPAAAAALEQFRSLWDEFREASRAERPANEDLALSIQQARSDPDEFFVRALTDPRLQGWMSAKQYEGKTLMEKFKDWIKSALFGFVKSGTAPSWLDAALLATSELNAAMLKDNPDFKRLSAINNFSSQKSALFSRVDDPNEASILLSRTPQQPSQADVPGMTANAAANTVASTLSLPAGWRDPTNRLQFAPGAWLYNVLGRAASPLLIKAGMKAASPELRRQIRQMKLDVQKAQEVSAAVAKDTQSLSEAERAMVSDIIEKELAAGIVPPSHAVRLAGLMTQAMGAQSKELVRLGMLTQESADRWDGAYLPRFYESKLRGATDAWADAVRKLLGRTSTMKGIKGKHLKGRGIFETIPEAEIPKYEALGWEVRDPDYQPGLPSVDGTVQVWRDYTRAERDKMGEIRDAGFRFVMGYMQTQRDIALGRMFENMANDPASSSRLPRDGWVRVPDTTIEGTGARRYGKLGGRYVPRETLSHLTQIEESQSAAWQMYRSAMAWWKFGKTALNPVSHVNNVLSNLTMAHFAGVGYHRADKYLAALKDFATKAPAVAEAKDAGLFLGTMSDAELMDTLPQELKDLAVKADSKTIRGVRFVFDAMTFFLRKPMGAAYQAEDTFFRYLIYKDGRSRGMSAPDAVDYAQKFIFTYDDLPSTARKIRDFGIPFFAYTYKAIPALLETALTHPARFATPAAIMWAANAAAYAIAASDDDDWWAAIQRYLTDEDYRKQVKEKERLEREVLAPWMKGNTAMGTPKTLRLGADEVTKLPLFIDVARIIPGGDLFDVSPNAGGLPIPQPLTPSHPLLTIATAMIGNRDLWTGKDLVDKNDTRAEAAEKRADWIWKQMTPAMAIGNYHWERSMNALAQASGGEIKWLPEFIAEDYTGIGRDNLPVQPKYAAMQTFGIKVRPMDLDRSRQMDESNQRRLIRDIDTELRTLNRLNRSGVISDKVHDKKLEEAKLKKERLREGLTVDGDPKN